MATGVLLTPPIVQFFGNNGQPAVNGSVLTQVGGVNTATYQDSGLTTALPNPIPLNSRGEVSTSNGVSQQCFLTPNVTYTLTLYDGPNATGNQLWTATYVNGVQTTLTPALVGAALYPQSAAESTAGVTPTAYQYPYGDLRRYGAVGGPFGSIPATDDSAAFALAASTGLIVIPQGFAFKIVTGATYTGTLTMYGYGKTSQIYNDGPLIQVTNGTNSFVDNFYMGNITPPYILTRNPASWATPITTLTQSSTALGYQPTVNDPEYTTLVATYPTIATQNIGPAISFSGNASDIEVSRIYGNFVTITLYDAVYSCVHDCDFRAGRGLGGIAFWNINNQLGVFNRAINNRIRYASFSGIVFTANYDGAAQGNQCMYSGESGIKTTQDLLAAVDARCYRMQITDNFTHYNYFDGLDISSSFTTATVTSRYCLVEGNHSYNNWGTGMNIDGNFNAVIGNHCYFNGRNGIWAATNGGFALGSIVGNVLVDNNQVRTAGAANCDLLVASVAGVGGCVISGNSVWAGAGQNNYGIYTPDANFCEGNFSPGLTSQFYFGATGSIKSVVQNYNDIITGLVTDQAFAFGLTNNAGTLQHYIVGEAGTGTSSILSSRVIGAVATSTNTPTGTDSSTAFAGGAKIGSAQTNTVWFNTAKQNTSYADFSVNVIYNQTGVTLLCRPILLSININGTTQVILGLQFYNSATGAAFALNTTNIASGNTIQVQFKGKLA